MILTVGRTFCPGHGPVTQDLGRLVVIVRWPPGAPSRGAIRDELRRQGMVRRHGVLSDVVSSNLSRHQCRCLTPSLCFQNRVWSRPRRCPHPKYRHLGPRLVERTPAASRTGCRFTPTTSAIRSSSGPREAARALCSTAWSSASVADGEPSFARWTLTSPRSGKRWSRDPG